MFSIGGKSQRRDDRFVTASSGEGAGRTERGARSSSLESAAHLDTAPDAMDLGFESLDFAQQLGDRPNEALIDIDLRMLVLRVLKEGLGGR